MSEADVWCVTPSASGGWGPVSALATLVGRLWQTTPRFIHPTRPDGRLRKAAAMLPRRRSGNRSLLLIAAQPGNLLALAQPGVLAGRYDQVGVWIIDSFWDDRIPLFARKRGGIDHVWITDAELTERYSQVMGLEAGWLPWGADALRAVRGAVRKDLDVLRLGRQPAVWDDDAANAEDLRRVGLTYQGRFPMPSDGTAAAAGVLERLQPAKTVLVSSNLASPADYVHPSREYISARFTDAVACGTRIAGVRPRCAAARLLPDEAWIELDVSSRAAGLQQLAAAVAEHDESRANRLRGAALQNLDWRHRIQVISRAFGVSSPTLTAEIADLGVLREQVCR